MRHDRHIARDISYSYSAQTRGGRAMIRTMENLTGRIRLIKRAEGYEREVAEGRDFWQVMVERYGLTLDVIGGSLANIPREGPLVLIANHPYGILDGLMMGHILSQTRPDFRILAHHVFRKAEDLNRIILPIDFDETKEAMALNLQTSFLTPPFGFALFYLRGAAPPEVSTMQIWRGAIPFIALQLIMIALVATLPGLATWLPSLVAK